MFLRTKVKKPIYIFSFVGREELRIPLKTPAQAQDYMGGEDTFDLKRMNAVV